MKNFTLITLITWLKTILKILFKNIVEIDSNQNILKIQDLEKSKEFKSYKFSKIYDDEFSTKEIYEDVCSDIVKKVKVFEHLIRNMKISRLLKRYLVFKQ